MARPHIWRSRALSDAALDYATAVGQDEPVGDSGLLAADATGEEAQAGNVGERRDIVQGRAADLSGPTPTLLPPPISDLLADPHAPAGGPVHQLEPATIPSDGLRVQRRAMLARSTTGEPVLWTQRRRELLLTPPTFALRFDIFQADPPPPA